MRTGKPEHLRTFDYIGPYRYFLTFCTFERRPRFADAHAVRLTREQILRACHEQHFAVIAYCYMPDHLHLLVGGTDAAAHCLRFITAAKQYSGFHYQKTFGDRLWQRYGYEHTLRDDEATLSVARYIVENPVRARLVKSVREHPFVGSETHDLDAILDAVQVTSGPAKAGHYSRSG